MIMLNEVTIIYAHPYEKSFNHAILQRVKELLETAGKQYTVLDLYADGFNPVYSKEELKYFSQGKALDPLVKEYQEKLTEAQSLIFIFPIWWNDLPAIVKGFFDKVMLKDFAYIDDGGSIKGKLTHIQKARVITTSEEPTDYIKEFTGDAINKVLINATFKHIGIHAGEWTNRDQISQISDEERIKFLADLDIS